MICLQGCHITNTCFAEDSPKDVVERGRNTDGAGREIVRRWKEARMEIHSRSKAKVRLRQPRLLEWTFPVGLPRPAGCCCTSATSRLLFLLKLFNTFSCIVLVLRFTVFCLCICLAGTQFLHWFLVPLILPLPRFSREGEECQTSRFPKYLC